MKDGELIKQINEYTSIRYCAHCDGNYIYFHGWEKMKKIKFKRECCRFRKARGRIRIFLDRTWPQSLTQKQYFGSPGDPADREDTASIETYEDTERR